MKKILITTFALSLAMPALAAQQDIAQISAVTAIREALRTAVNTQLSAVQANFDELYTAVGTRPWVIQATAPADTTLAWFDTDQVVDAVVLKIHNGERWVPQAIGEGGSYTLPTAAADTLGGVKVGARLTITDGVLSADVQTTDISGKENSLGNPSTSGYVLSSTTSGVRSWIEMTGGGTGIAHATSDGNYYASKDGGWASLAGVFLAPTGSADLLTITDTGTYFTTDTVGAALQELGSELADVTEITLDASLTETGGVLSVTNPLSLPTTDNQLLQATGAGTYAWTSTIEGIGNITGGTYNKITVTPPATGATLTLAEGSTLATSGAYSTTLTATGATNVTLPTSGTLIGSADLGTGVETFLGTPSSANLASAITGETGSGAAVFGTSPELSGVSYPSSTSTSTGTGNINIDGVSADHYYFNNGASAATYTPVIASPPASGKERAIVLTVGGGAGVITMTWTNVSFLGTAGAATTTANKYSHYGCFIRNTGNAICKIIAEAEDY